MSQTEQTKKQKVLSIVGIVVIAILSVVLIANIVVIVKGFINPNSPPSFFGKMALVVETGSMSGNNKDSFDEGSLIFISKVDPADLKEGEVITFYDPESTKNAIVTHRIVKITETAGGLAFTTKGDANNIEDGTPVPASNIIGRYSSHINGIGNFFLFLQKPLGMVLCIGVPVILVVIYDLVYRQILVKKENDKKTEELEAEIARLKALSKEEVKEENS